MTTRDRIEQVQRDLQQVAHEIRTVALIDWQLHGNRADALRRWAQVTAEADEALAAALRERVAPVEADAKQRLLQEIDGVLDDMKQQLLKRK